MSHLFERLAMRQLAPTAGLVPRLPGPFESISAAGSLEPIEADERADVTPDLPLPSSAGMPVHVPVVIEHREPSLPPVPTQAPTEARSHRVPTRHASEGVADPRPRDKPIPAPIPNEHQPTPLEQKPQAMAPAKPLPQGSSIQQLPIRHRRPAARSDSAIGTILTRSNGMALVPIPPQAAPIPPVMVSYSDPIDRAPSVAPNVTISIGRLLVRAAHPSSVPDRQPPDLPKTLSLDDYLERRHGARR